MSSAIVDRVADQLILELRGDPIVAADVNSLLDMWRRDIPHYQAIRELFQNGLEAIQETLGGTGTIAFMPSPLHDGGIKLAVVDTGVGMTGPEMMLYLKRLSSSGKDLALDKNFGLGAKIAALTHNPAGLQYFSWKDGRGYFMHLHRNAQTGEYEAVRYEQNGTYHSWLEIEDDSIKPSMIQRHGTMVVLMGEDDDDNTMVRSDMPSPARWIHHYLNSRYFRFPEGITVTAPWNKTENMRRVVGMEDHLERIKTASGQVPLTGAIAHWWIVKEESSKRPGHVPNPGHIAALFRDELYEMKSGIGGAHLLHQFGVMLGHKQVVIYVEPDTEIHSVMTDMLRTRLIMEGESLPWAEWAKEFAAQLPEEIRALGADSAKPSADIKESIARRLTSISNLLRLVSKPARDGLPPQGGRKAPAFALGPKKVEPAPAPQERRRGRNKPKAVDPLGIDVRFGRKDDVDNPARAVNYTAASRTLVVNCDFHGIQEFVDRAVQAYGEQAREHAEHIATGWCVLPVIEAIARIEAMRGHPNWTDQDIASALSSEALTAVALPIYHARWNITRDLGSKFGAANTE